MTLLDDLSMFKWELQAMNRKLDQVIQLLKMLVEAQCENSEKGNNGPESE